MESQQEQGRVPEAAPTSSSQQSEPKSNAILLIVIFLCLIFLSLSSVIYHKEKSEARQAGGLKMISGSSEIPASDQSRSAPPPSTTSAQQAGKPEMNIVLGGKVFAAEIANTNELRERGLSGRAAIGESDAMVFVFPTDGQHLFWMKDMGFSIDMIWLDADKRIVHIAKNATPESYPQTFGPASPTRYVVEIQAGVSDKLGLNVGDLVGF